MLLKGCQASETEKKSRTTGNKQHRSTANAMKLTSTVSSPRSQRKMVQRVGSKRPAPGKRIAGHGMLEVPAVDPCDSSNDSGLGFEHHSELQVARSALRYSDHELHWANQGTAVKRKKVEIKLETDDANDNFTFEETMIQAKRDPMHAELLLPLTTRIPPTRAPVARVVSRRPAVATAPRRGGAPSTAANQQLAFSRAAPKPFLQILSQPEQQHRARYQTEGSRGAVKDRTGNSFPAVKLVGYEGQATLQVFIGSDVGRAVPHMFYQACRVSGKNSTPCTEKTVDGTVVIEVEFDAAKDMIVTCDCVGILKERNVDVEHRFPDQSGARSKKKSTRCRMVFRSVVTLADGTKETLEITSQHIVCTQPPGIPEICKKSLSSSPCGGGQELFILGKNFLKDTCVVFTNTDVHPPWEVSVSPDKEYLQQSHLVCVVPAYADAALTAPVSVRLSVSSSGKMSESHSFTYTPTHMQAGNREEGQKSVTEVQSGSNQLVGSEASEQARLPTIGGIVRPANAQYLFVQSSHDGGKDAVFLWKPQSAETSKLPLDDPSTKALVPTPQTRPIFLVGHIPASQKVPAEDGSCSPALPRSPTQHAGMEIRKTTLAAMPTETASDNHFPISISISTTLNQFTSTSVGMPVASMLTSDSLKPSTEPDQHYASSNLAVPMATGADLSSTQSPSLATLRRFVSSENTGSPLPSLSVEKFLSGLEHNKSGAESMLRSTLSAHKEENCRLSVNVAVPPNMDDSRQMPQVLQRNIEQIEESSLYQQPLNTSQHSPILMAHNSLSSAYGDQLMQGHLLLHGKPTTTTTMTMAKTQNVSSSLISAAQNARLDAMVSSAMDSAAATHGNSQKLEDLLHCAANSHLDSANGKNALVGTAALEHIPLSAAGAMSLTTSSEHIFAECKAETGVVGASAELPAQSSLMMMPSVFESSLHSASLMSPALASNGQLIGSPIGELLCNTVNSMALPPVCATDSIIVTGSASMMQSSNCAASTMLDMPCASEPLMISARCPSDPNVILDMPCTTVPLTEANQCHPSSIALTNMIMHSAASSTTMYHPVQAAPMMENMLLSAAARAGDQLPTPETVRLDALVNSALDSHILPAGAPVEAKCSIFPGTSAVDCHSAGVCPSVDECFTPATTVSHCCPEQLHFAAAVAVANDAGGTMLLPAAMDKVKCQVTPGPATNQEKREEVMVPRELTQMSENDLLSYINPSCFDTL